MMTADEVKRLADQLSMADGARSIPMGELWRGIAHSQYVAKRTELHAAIEALAAPQPTPDASQDGGGAEGWRRVRECMIDFAQANQVRDDSIDASVDACDTTEKALVKAIEALISSKGNIR
jgi:hypothetical protein